jgi:hypothetical protein
MKDDHCEVVTILNKWLMLAAHVTLPHCETKSGQSNIIIMLSYMARILTDCLAIGSEISTSLLPKPGSEHDAE